MNVPLRFIRNYYNFLWAKPNNSNTICHHISKCRDQHNGLDICSVYGLPKREGKSLDFSSPFGDKSGKKGTIEFLRIKKCLFLNLQCNFKNKLDSCTLLVNPLDVGDSSVILAVSGAALLALLVWMWGLSVSFSSVLFFCFSLF
jgi:hypothetical protein